MTSEPRPMASRDEEDRAFLQRRATLFWKVVFLISLATDALQVVYDPVTALLRPVGVLDRLSTAGLGLLWLLCRRGSRSVRFVQATEAVGLFLVSVTISLMGRYLVTTITPEVFRDLGAVDLSSPIVERGMEGFVSMMVLCGGAIVFFLRAAIIPTRPLRSLALTAAAGSPYVMVPPLVAPGTYGRLAFRDEPRSAVALLVTLGIWWLVVTASSTVISRIVYGLRREAREARRLGQYTLERKLGEGGMGVVYRARHGMMRRPTAIKLLPPERSGESNVQRFEREVRLTARLTHPNTVTIFDYGRTPDGVFYYAMELLEGASLESVVGAGGPMAAERVVHVLSQVAGALAEAHDIGIVHRDIKPANVILCRQGGVDDVAKVVDFGLVKQLDRDSDVRLTHANVITGTPLYLSPEAITAPETVGPRSDLYSLGAVGYFMLTGEHVFDGRTLVEVCSHHLHTTPEPPSGRIDRALPKDLEALVLACLEKDPTRRPASAGALRQGLEACGCYGRWTTGHARVWWREHGAATAARDEAIAEDSPVILSRRLESPIGQ